MPLYKINSSASKDYKEDVTSSINNSSFKGERKKGKDNDSKEEYPSVLVSNPDEEELIITAKDIIL